MNGMLKLPFYLSDEACGIIIALMNRNPNKRLGAGKEDAEEVKRNSWFSSIDWKVAKERGLEVPRLEEWVAPEGDINPDIFGNKASEENIVKDWGYTKDIVI